MVRDRSQGFREILTNVVNEYTNLTLLSIIVNIQPQGQKEEWE